jgi:hypothetical protein
MMSASRIESLWNVSSNCCHCLHIESRLENRIPQTVYIVLVKAASHMRLFQNAEQENYDTLGGFHLGANVYVESALPARAVRYL